MQQKKSEGMSLLAWMFWWGLAVLALFGIYCGYKQPFGYLSVNKTLFLIFFYLVIVLTAWLCISAHNETGLWEPEKPDEKSKDKYGETAM